MVVSCVARTGPTDRRLGLCFFSAAEPGRARGFDWVAVSQLKLSYDRSETIVFKATTFHIMVTLFPFPNSNREPHHTMNI